MTIDDAISQFSSASAEQQIRILASFAHELTIAARAWTYEPGTTELVAPQRMRELNEIQHRVTAHLCRLLGRDEARYPDDVLVRIIVGEDDTGLLGIFARVLRAGECNSGPQLRA